MRNKFDKVLVTGGAGLIGSHIIDILVKEEECGEIIALDNMIRGQRSNLEWAMANGPVRLIEGDIRDNALVKEMMEGVDVLFHMAALRITHCAAEPRLAMEVMADATFALLEAAVEANVGKVIAASSASVYGMAEEFPTTESHHPYENRTLYGACKVFLEGLLRSFNDMYGLNYIALRYFNVYGPRVDIHGKYTEVLIRWMERVEQGQPPMIFGDGSATMDFVYIEDLARCNVLAAKSDITDRVFNVASQTETSLKELADALLTTMGSDLGVKYGPERSVNPVPRRLADTFQAREQLGFKTTIPLDEGLRRMVEWWRQERGKLTVEQDVRWKE